MSSISLKTTIQADKNKYFKIPAFDKLWTTYKRSTRALAVRWQSERLMRKNATLYYDNNVIFITIEGSAHVSIDDNLSDFSYEVEP